MATELSRTTSVRKVCAKPGESTNPIYLKVIDNISFIDPATQYQEYQYSFNNTPTAPREVTTDTVGDIEVERIKSISVVDPSDYYQEALYAFLNFEPGVHLETHRTKIYAINDDGTKNESAWIEVERVDKISFVDSASQYQEYIYELKWPDLTNPNWDYENLTPVVTAYDNSSINPPWRVDPFQNIVAASGVRALFFLLAQNDGYTFTINGDFTVSFPPQSDPEFFETYETLGYVGDISQYANDGLIPLEEYYAIYSFKSFSEFPFKAGETNTVTITNGGGGLDWRTSKAWVYVFFLDGDTDVTNFVGVTKDSDTFTFDLDPL